MSPGRRRLSLPTSSQRGAALVEMAIVLFLLLLLVLGIVEFGVMFRNYMTLDVVARVGCRSAALGSGTSVVSGRITNAAGLLGLNSQYLTNVDLQYRVYDKAGGVWTGWQALGNAGSGYNNAPSDVNYDSQVKVGVAYTYPLITGSFFSGIIGQSGDVTLTGSCAMRREETP